MTRRYAAIAGLLLGCIATAWFYLWFTFHSIPTQNDLQSALERAEAIELVYFTAGKPNRYVRLEGDTRQWSAWTRRIRFQQRFWAFGSPPVESYLIQAFEGKERTGAFEVRADDCLYIRKAVRWYRMPIEPGFFVAIRDALAKSGQPVPAETIEYFERQARQ